MSRHMVGLSECGRRQLICFHGGQRSPFLPYSSQGSSGPQQHEPGTMVASGRVTKEPLSMVALHRRSYGATVSIHYLQLAVGGILHRHCLGSSSDPVPRNCVVWLCREEKQIWSPLTLGSPAPQALPLARDSYAYKAPCSVRSWYPGCLPSSELSCLGNLSTGARGAKMVCVCGGGGGGDRQVPVTCSAGDERSGWVGQNGGSMDCYISLNSPCQPSLVLLIQCKQLRSPAPCLRHDAVRLLGRKGLICLLSCF